MQKMEWMEKLKIGDFVIVNEGDLKTIKKVSGISRKCVYVEKIQFSKWNAKRGPYGFQTSVHLLEHNEINLERMKKEREKKTNFLKDFDLDKLHTRDLKYAIKLIGFVNLQKIKDGELEEVSDTELLDLYKSMRRVEENKIITLLTVIEKDTEEEAIEIMRKNPEFIKKEGIYSPFLHAIEKGKENVAEFMIEQGVNKNQIGSLGRSAVFQTIPGSQVDMLRKLKQLGFDLNAKNDMGESFLIRAIKSNRPIIAKYLVLEGADVDYVSRKGESVLSLIESGNKTLDFYFIEENKERFNKENQMKINKMRLNHIYE